eukprot:7350232-Lingulodinium_polyedra.AAC.1
MSFTDEPPRRIFSLSAANGARCCGSCEYRPLALRSSRKAPCAPKSAGGGPASATLRSRRRKTAACNGAA